MPERTLERQAAAAEWPVVGGGVFGISSSGFIRADTSMAGRGDWRGQRPGNSGNSGGGRGSWMQGRGYAGGGGFWAAGRGDAGGGGAGWRGPTQQRPPTPPIFPTQPNPLGGGTYGVEHGFGGGQHGQGEYLVGRDGHGSGQHGNGGFVSGQQGQFYQQPLIPPSGNFQTHPAVGFGAVQFGQMGNDALGSYQYSGTSNSPNQQGRGYGYTDFKSNQSGTSTGPANIGSRSQMTCYKCENTGDAVKDCQTVLFCVNCTKDSHLSRKCSFLSQPKPVASVVGSVADGLQMFSTRTGKKPEPDKNKQAIAIITVKSASLTVLQLVNSLSMMFQWGWEWQAKPYLRDSFLVKFPSVNKIDEMKAYNFFGLIGTTANIKVDRWTNSSTAAFKLYVCWVRITGVPETLEHYQGFCEASSLIGSVLELDMELYRQCGVLRAKIRVMDPRKIPSSAPLNESGFIFNIYFQLEDIVEEGGPMEDGILVSYPNGPDSSHNATKKRPREQSNNEEVGCSKSPKHGIGAGRSDKGNTSGSSEVVIPSQYELDKNMVAENEVRQKLLDKKRDAERVLSGVEQVNAEFANSAAMLEDFTEVPDSQKEVEFDCTQDPDDFARRLGISTQKVKEINDNVEREMIAEENENLLLAQDKENRSPSLVSSTQAVTAPGREVNQKQTPFSDKVDACLQYPLQDLCGVDAVNKQKMREAEARVQKAKDKAALDEAARRRSERHKNKDEGQTMDKATEMAKKKKMEMAPEKRCAKNA